MTEKEKEMEELKKECMGFCYKHPLYKQGTYPVFGEGSVEAKILFCGEAPGLNESLSGHPFCGEAGEILDELLNSAGIKREEVYITNLVKVRPPNNRDPKPEEIKEFAPYLDRQIEIIEPKIICSLGNFPTSYIMERYGLKEQIQGISKIHGKVFESRSLFGKIKIVPLYHPAAATYNPHLKETLKKDFSILKTY